MTVVQFVALGLVLAAFTSSQEMSLWVQLPVCTEGLAGGESCQRRRGSSSSEKSLFPPFLHLRWAVAPVCLQQRLIRWGDTTPVKVWSQTQVFWGWRAMSCVNAENEEGTENIILFFFSQAPFVHFLQTFMQFKFHSHEHLPKASFKIL